ncbi:MAG: hypothetical protein ACXAC2_09740, partial [Candidatus Kariarchaeaceae archaeon]
MRSDSSYGRYDYQLNINPSNDTPYTILFPVPDDMVLHNHQVIGNGTFQIVNTDHGLALEIISNDSINFTSSTRDAKSTWLSMRE